MGEVNKELFLNDILRKGSEWDYKIRGMIGKKISNKRGLREDCYSLVQEAIWRAVEKYTDEKSNGKSLKNWVLLHIDNAITDFLRTIYADKNQMLVFRPHTEIDTSDGTRMPIPDPNTNPESSSFDPDNYEVLQQKIIDDMDEAERGSNKADIETERLELQKRKILAEAKNDKETLINIIDREDEIKSRAIDLGLEVDKEDENYEMEVDTKIEELDEQDKQDEINENTDMNLSKSYKKERDNKNLKRREQYARRKRKPLDTISEYQHQNSSQSAESYRPILDQIKEHLNEWELNIIEKMLEGYSITEIAKYLGYNDHSFVSKSLKKIRAKTIDLIRKNVIEIGTENEFITNSIYGSTESLPKSKVRRGAHSASLSQVTLPKEQSQKNNPKRSNFFISHSLSTTPTKVYP